MVENSDDFGAARLLSALEISDAKVAEAEKESVELKIELERVNNTLGWRQRRKLGYPKS